MAIKEFKNQEIKEKGRLDVIKTSFLPLLFLFYIIFKYRIAFK